jgi:hypothetical protein
MGLSGLEMAYRPIQPGFIYEPNGDYMGWFLKLNPYNPASFFLCKDFQPIQPSFVFVRNFAVMSFSNFMSMGRLGSMEGIFFEFPGLID